MKSQQDITQLIIEGIHERKGRGVTLVDLSALEYSATSHFVIAEGNSATHAAAIAESVEEYVRKNSGVKPFAIDDAGAGDWVILDYGDTWVHIFLPETRQHYNLEELWSDGTISHIPDLD